MDDYDKSAEMQGPHFEYKNVEKWIKKNHKEWQKELHSQ